MYPAVAPIVVIWRRRNGSAIPLMTSETTARTASATVGTLGGAEELLELALLLDDVLVADAVNVRATFALYSLRGRRGGRPLKNFYIKRVDGET